MVILGFWILNENGMKILSVKNDEKLEIDSDIFSALVTTIHSFSKSAGLTPIKQTETEELLILYQYRSHLLFILVGEKHEDPEKLERSLNDYQNFFFHFYENLVWEYYLQFPTPDGTFDVFKDKMNTLFTEESSKTTTTSGSNLEKAFSKIVKQVPLKSIPSADSNLSDLSLASATVSLLEEEEDEEKSEIFTELITVFKLYFQDGEFKEKGNAENTILEINEESKQAFLRYNANTSLIAQRTAGRQARAICKTGFLLHNGWRIGINCSLEEISGERKIDDRLLQEGHKYH